MTRLKAAGIDLATMGVVDVDVHDARPRGARRFTDPTRGRYAKLVVREDRLVGAILLGVGDAAGALVTSSSTGARRAGTPGTPAAAAPCPHRRDRARSTSPRCPARAVICRCNSVTKAAIVGAVRGGADTVERVADGDPGDHRLRRLPGAVGGLLVAGSAEPAPRDRRPLR